MMPGNAHVVEIWNGPWAGDSNNEAALALWYDWLNQGRRMVATAGTDSHSNSDYAEGPGFNVIGAEALTESALLAAVRAGRLYLSSGPRLTFEARDARGTRWGIGQSVAAGAGALTFEASWSDCAPGVEVRVMVDGRLYDARPAGGAGQGAWALQPEQATWVVLEVRAADGVLLAITNPIFV
jgi:hypothetical protein